MTWTDLGNGRSVYRPASPDDWRIPEDALRPYLNPAVLAELDRAAAYWDGVRRRLLGRSHGVAGVRQSLRDGAWTAECTCGCLWRALDHAGAVAAVTDVCNQTIMTGDEIMGRETDELDAALATAVQLSREAVAAGLVVTQLGAMKCHGGYGNCYVIQIWQADGRLWAEGSHETVASVRRHIHSYARGRSNDDMDADRRRHAASLEAAGWTQWGPNFWTAPVGTPEPGWDDEITGGSDGGTDDRGGVDGGAGGGLRGAGDTAGGGDTGGGGGGDTSAAGADAG